MVKKKMKLELSFIGIPQMRLLEKILKAEEENKSLHEKDRDEIFQFREQLTNYLSWEEETEDERSIRLLRYHDKTGADLDGLLGD